MNNWSKTVGTDFKSSKRYSVILVNISATPWLMELKADDTIGDVDSVGK